MTASWIGCATGDRWQRKKGCRGVSIAITYIGELLPDGNEVECISIDPSAATTHQGAKNADFTN